MERGVTTNKVRAEESGRIELDLRHHQRLWDPFSNDHLFYLPLIFHICYKLASDTSSHHVSRSYNDCVCHCSTTAYLIAVLTSPAALTTAKAAAMETTRELQKIPDLIYPI